MKISVRPFIHERSELGVRTQQHTPITANTRATDDEECAEGEPELPREYRHLRSAWEGLLILAEQEAAAG